MLAGQPAEKTTKISPSEQGTLIMKRSEAFPTNCRSSRGTDDWRRIRAEVIARLDIEEEYRALGVEFTRSSATPKGWLECRAVGRKDEHPSAAVNLSTGVYHDSGGEGLTLGFFDFALRFGGDRFGRYLDVLKHYADRAGVPLPEVAPGKGGRIREAVYEYQDAEGVLRYAVFRYRLPNGSKSFSQHPSDGHGGWRYGAGCMDGVEPLPYRLPELLASADEPVIIVEGEKDVDRLREEGLVSTTNHQGAQSTEATWPKFLPYFTDRDCVILSDNDPGGQQHAQKVAAILKPVARSIKVLNLPGLPPKGDVSVWFDQGHDLQELDQLVSEAPLWEPGAPEPSPEPRRFATVADVRRILSGTRWVWDGWIPTARIAGIAGSEGTGKTRFALDLCRRVWNGLPWPDGSEMTLPKESRFVWICADAHQDELAEILPAFGIPDEAVVFPTTPDDPYGGTDIDNPETFEALAAAIEAVRPALVFIDTLTSATSRDLCDQRTMKPLKTSMAHLTQTFQVPILFMLHLSREGQALGRRIKAVTRTLMHLECPNQEQPTRLRLWVEKTFSKRPPQLGVTMTDTGNQYDNDPPSPLELNPSNRRSRPVGRPSTGQDLARSFILATVSQRGTCRLAALIDEFIASGGSKSSFFRARDVMVSAGEIICDGSPMTIRLVNVAPLNGDSF